MNNSDLLNLYYTFVYSLNDNETLYVKLCSLFYKCYDRIFHNILFKNIKKIYDYISDHMKYIQKYISLKYDYK